MNKSLKFQNQFRNITNEKVNKLKTKDPKKVAAGKKLAELNKKAKGSLAQEMKREADPEDKWLQWLVLASPLQICSFDFTDQKHR